MAKYHEKRSLDREVLSLISVVGENHIAADLLGTTLITSLKDMSETGGDIRLLELKTFYDGLHTTKKAFGKYGLAKVQKFYTDLITDLYGNRDSWQELASPLLRSILVDLRPTKGTGSIEHHLANRSYSLISDLGGTIKFTESEPLEDYHKLEKFYAAGGRK